jgi:hypothetical protein
VRSCLVLVVASCLGYGGCGSTQDNGWLGTVDLGDDFVAPALRLDEAFFYCRIQPDVLTRHSCAQGGSGEAGSCHDSASALRLIASDAAPPCDGDGVLIDDVPDAYRANFDAVSFAVQSDPLTSPLYLRPTGQASHPRAIFGEDDEAAQLIVDWISGAAE